MKSRYLLTHGEGRGTGRVKPPGIRRRGNETRTLGSFRFARFGCCTPERAHHGRRRRWQLEDNPYSPGDSERARDRAAVAAILKGRTGRRSICRIRQRRSFRWGRRSCWCTRAWALHDTPPDVWSSARDFGSTAATYR